MRLAVYQALSNDLQLNELGIAAATLLEQSAVDTPTARPFAVTRWGVDAVGVGTLSRRTLQLWVHDDLGTYDRIDKIINRAKDVLSYIEGVKDQEGGWVSQVDWLGDSADLSDDQQGTAVRYATFTVVGSRTD